MNEWLSFIHPIAFAKRLLGPAVLEGPGDMEAELQPLLSLLQKGSFPEDLGSDPVAVSQFIRLGLSLCGFLGSRKACWE